MKDPFANIATSVTWESMRPLNMSPPALSNEAEWMYERIVRSINDFEADLDNEHEIGARLTSFNAGEVISIEDVGYWGPDMIIFHGRDRSDQPAQLLQHISQVNVLLVAVKVEKDEPRRIGFILTQKLEKSEDGA